MRDLPGSADVGILPSRKDGEEPRESLVDRVDAALTEGTPYAAFPDLEGAPVSAKDREYYQAFALILFLVSAFALVVCIAYAPDLWRGIVLASVFLSFLVPPGIALMTMKKIYFGIGLVVFGAVYTVLGALAIAQDVFHVGPGVASTAQLSGALWDALFFLGLPALFMGRRVIRRKKPIYGLR